MRKSLLCFMGLLSSALLVTGPVNAANCDPKSSPIICKGQPCSPLGATMMDTDSEHIISCLKYGSATIWKAQEDMSGGASSCKAEMDACVSAGGCNINQFHTFYLYAGVGYGEVAPSISSFSIKIGGGAAYCYGEGFLDGAWYGKPGHFTRPQAVGIPVCDARGKLACQVNSQMRYVSAW